MPLGLSPVPAINVTQYLGRWYQMYDDLLVQGTFEANSYCDTADYALNPNGTVSVHNRERVGSVSGVESEIYGYAAQSDPSNPGALTVYLQGVPVGAPYWIFLLGPATYTSANLYQYAVVSDPLQLSLFVLARNVTDFYAHYDAPVRQWLNATGFNNLVNTPIATTQLGCTYWE